MVTLLFVFILAGSFGAASARKVERMKILFVYAHGDLSMDLLKGFAASVREKSNGQTNIKDLSIRRAG